MMIEQHLRVVRTMIDAYGLELDQAFERAQVPLEVREQVRVKYEEETTVPIRPAHVLSGNANPCRLLEDWDPSTGYYWPRQRMYLIDALRWGPRIVESIDNDTDTILRHLADPRPTGSQHFLVRGLVMGYVQSGKTANFCALTAKAADAGYKLVIVLSGIHNSLRLQTQRRLNRTLGLDPRNGVSEPEPGKRWIGLTTATLGGDFRSGTIDANVLQGNEHVLIVCKKNASVLRRLTSWMNGRCPENVPVLVIDDEADQASINTGGNRPPIDETDLTQDDLDDTTTTDEVDPSTINGLVRSLLHSFSRVAYVAYTATPFANVLINHLAIDREVFEDLYPRDFIVALPRPAAYCGAERLFGREALTSETGGVEGLNIIDFVPETKGEALNPPTSQIGTYTPPIVPSLRTAVIDFFLATAGRHTRTLDDFPATMLVHTHHRRAVQNQLRTALSELVSELRNSWRYDRSQSYPEFIARWTSRFVPVLEEQCPERPLPDTEQIVEGLDKLFLHQIPVLVLNSDSTDQLDYDAYQNLKAIVVGGNRLSRGLTLEGLLVSYYIRRAGYFDTLMQMARWFGFREDYVDLTRIWTTTELAGWFRDLSLAEEELRSEIARYEKERLTPLDFGPKIRTHPAMMVTARNKMGAAQILHQNYSESLLQTTKFRLEDPLWLEENLQAGADLLARLGPPYEGFPGRIIWSDVSWRDITSFLQTYKLHPRSQHDMQAIRQYIHQQAEQNGELTRWHTAIIERQAAAYDLGTEPSLSIRGRPVNRIARTRLRNAPDSIGSLVNPATKQDVHKGDETIGLSEEQIQAALDETNGEEESLGRALRRKRSPGSGLLLLYPISPYSAPPESSSTRIPLFDNPADGRTVLGLTLVFPSSNSNATITYYVGSVGHITEEP